MTEENTTITTVTDHDDHHHGPDNRINTYSTECNPGVTKKPRLIEKPAT
jgi:hypothetical protein